MELIALFIVGYLVVTFGGCILKFLFFILVGAFFLSIIPALLHSILHGFY